MVEKKTKSDSASMLGIFTAVLLLAKLLESPYLEGVPFWSFNPFTFSVFIIYTWAFWILLTFGIVYVILVVTGKARTKKADNEMSKIIENILKRYNKNN